MQSLSQETRQATDIRITGTSRAAQEIRDFARRASKFNETLLLTGETGVGKDHLAEYIHSLGADGRPFVPVDCGTLPRDLVESHLFGYVRGAYTGAGEGKDGLIQAAEGGTLFLNEVANMSIELQSKLLRVAEGRSYRKVGGTQEIQIRTRIIAGTNVDLSAKVEAGRFKLDLFYRLATITYQIPALRERPEDIEPLSYLFLKQL
ncbi:sigma-54 factor interaction domain-containing protein, partial [Candidatus Parcubacteria bacterium]|nr:sigma-54 factor interaction domain-containing protein [Candidatus Parcubacteria bacterium]